MSMDTLEGQSYKAKVNTQLWAKQKSCVGNRVSTFSYYSSG